jgi:hypothetical protein
MLKKCTKCWINKYLKEFYISWDVISARCKKCTNKIKIQKKQQKKKEIEENIRIIKDLWVDNNWILNEKFTTKDYEYIKSLNTESNYYEVKAFMRFIQWKKIEMVRQEDVKRDKILIFY